MIASNQSGIVRGYFDLETLHAMHEKMDRLLAALGGKVEAVFFCPHGPDEDCSCRKPKPGLLQEIAARYKTTLEGVVPLTVSVRM